ncbi:MAG: hypothetical protein IJ088_02200 [Clostridia bacterium]|nr:hypothetical protein [Clostridia bacterium]
MDRIRVNSDLLHSAGMKIGRSADQMDEGLHDLHRVIEILEEYGNSEIIEKCIRELESCERVYKRLQGQAFGLERAIGRVAETFDKREKDTVKLGNQLNMAAGYTLDWLGFGSYIPFRRTVPGETRYTEYQENLAEALKALLVQVSWIAPAILIPEWLQQAADENENNRQ